MLNKSINILLTPNFWTVVYLFQKEMLQCYSDVSNAYTVIYIYHGTVSLS